MMADNFSNSTDIQEQEAQRLIYLNNRVTGNQKHTID